MTQILNGKEVAESIRAKVKTEVESLSQKPGLAVVLVGEDPASKAYVGMKKKACAEAGINSYEYKLSNDAPESELIQIINKLNADSDVDGILVQLPLPAQMDEDKIISLINPQKDVDGFHPINVGNLLIGRDTLKSCTPYGVMEILKYYKIDPAGKHVVIVGRSNIVGKPLAAMLIQKDQGANATVTICHSRTQKMAEITRSADILIAAIGKPEFITSDMVKKDAVVIDVGINRVDADNEKGYKLVGDVDTQNVTPIATAITPVPGGVGPMTIAMLLSNTLKAHKKRNA